MSRIKRKIDIVPRTRYMSVQMGQLAVADIREILPGDFCRHRCRIGIHLSPMQAPELSPIVVRQDTYFTPNRVLWDYWDNYISQKLLEDTAVGPFSEDKLLPPQLSIFLGAGFNNQSQARHLSDVRGVYDCLEGLDLKLGLTDAVNSASVTSGVSGLGTLLQFSAFPLMAYWRIWHDFYRDAFLQNDSFKAISLNRTPEFGDPWADEQPVDDTDADSTTVKQWDSTLRGNLPSGVVTPTVYTAGLSLPGYVLDVWTAGSTPHQRIRGVFTFAKRHPAMCVAVAHASSSTSTTLDATTVLPGTCAVIPADLGSNDAQLGVLPPTGGLGFYAPVCMPKDYIFTARQSPVYNSDVAVPGSVRDLRKAFQVLGYREKVNRFDNRIKAWMRSMFGINISDKRLDSPYWLGGSQSVINTQEILGTVNNTNTVLGQLGGYGIGAVRGRTVKMRSEDHGFLMTVFYIVPLPVYGDGASRFWFRGALSFRSRQPFADGPLDYPLPDFARIGQQSIYRGELSLNGNYTNSSGTQYNYYARTFGYGDRYSDLSFSRSDVCGDFRTTLRFWHTGLFFGNLSTPSSPADADLARAESVSGSFVSLFDRTLNNMRVSRTGQVRSSISSNLTARLFDSGVTADPFWCVVSTDFYCSRRIPTHPQPGHADHTRRN